jgi:hypothetical protein
MKLHTFITNVCQPQLNLVLNPQQREATGITTPSSDLAMS